MAGLAGLEPTIRESKSRVLPLHYNPILCETHPHLLHEDFHYLTCAIPFLDMPSKTLKFSRIAQSERVWLTAQC